MLGMADTIFAAATGAGRAAVAILRLSGPGSRAALERLAGPCPPPRAAVLRTLREGGATLDRALVLWFPAPASFTGEDVVELHCHGGRAVVAAVLTALAACPGLRPAEPGEFTRRAFANGRMDLAEVEGLADLIDAQTEAQRRQALRQTEGALGQWVAQQRRRLVTALAAAESAIDFSDEADVAGDFCAEVRREVAALRTAVEAERTHAVAAERLREGFVVVIAGPPNAGKSTLINALARRDIAIVSPQAGTTRDAVAVSLDLGGHLVELVDTAGLRETEDAVEQAGIARALDKARRADLVLWLTEAGAPAPPDPGLQGVPALAVVTKCDLAVGPLPPGLPICAMTGEGLPALVQAIAAEAERRLAGAETAVATRLRHRRALDHAAVRLDRLFGSGGDLGLELVADDLRAVAADLDSLVGRIAGEDILDVIFARFCIGK